MSVKPKVSIIIPLYNTEKYVYRALESVRSQRYENIEAIVINDGASDSSGEIAERFCHEDERFIYLEQENGGASSARNNGLTKVTGKYVTFLDSDDTMPDDAIMNMVTYAEKSKAHLVIGEIQYISFIGKRTSLKFAEKLSQKENIDILDVDITYNLKVNNKLFRADIIINNKLIFENFAIDEDAVFLYDYLLFCNTAAGCPHITYNYYQQNLYDAGSLSNSTDKRSIASMFDATDAVIEKAYKLLEGEGYSRQDKTAIRYINILVTRFIYLEIIGTYRRIWNSEEILDLLNNKLNDYKKIISKYAWNKIIAKNRDIDLTTKLLSKEELSARPMIGIIIGDKVPDDELNFVIGNIYNQKVPSFHLFIKKSRIGNIAKEYIEKENFTADTNRRFGTGNIRKYKEIIDKLKVKYIMMIDDALYIGSDAVKDMFDALEADNDLELFFGNTDKKCECDPKVVMVKSQAINNREKLKKFSAGTYEIFNYSQTVNDSFRCRRSDTINCR